MLEFVVDQTLLKNAVEPLTWIATIGTVVTTLDGVKLIGRCTDDYIFFVVLSYRRRDFALFFCDFETVTGVDLDDLHEILGTIVRDPLYELEGEKLICFYAPDFVQRVQITSNNSSEHLGLRSPNLAAEEGYRCESQREYCVVAAVPSLEFRSILNRLFDHGNEVFITITETEVMFSVFHMLVTLRKEHSECIIGATSVEDYPARVVMDTDYAGPFMLASNLSNTVWILHCDDPMALHQFNIPVGDAGNLMFYIP